MELAKLMIDVKLWDKARKGLEKVIGRFQALQITANTVRKIEIGDEMLRELSGRLIDARPVTQNVTLSAYMTLRESKTLTHIY